MRILEICADTRQGERSLNEDSFVLQHEDLSNSLLALVAVADGIGGMGSGHMASSTALTTLSDVFKRLATQHAGPEEPPVLDWLSYAFQKANTTLLRMGLTMKELRGMGTTCTAAVISAQGTLYTCHVGDSRAYLLREGHLTQITQDDWFRGIRDAGNITARTRKTKLADLRRGHEAEGSGQPAEMTLVTQALGWQPFIEPTKSVRDVKPGDVILVCTDGLTDNLNTKEIESILHVGGSGQEMCSELASMAAQKPGSDNATAAVIRVGN